MNNDTAKCLAGLSLPPPHSGSRNRVDALFFPIFRPHLYATEVEFFPTTLTSSLFSLDVLLIRSIFFGLFLLHFSALKTRDATSFTRSFLSRHALSAPFIRHDESFFSPESAKLAAPQTSNWDFPVQSLVVLPIFSSAAPIPPP